MRSLFVLSGIFCVAVSATSLGGDKDPELKLFPEVGKYIELRLGEFAEITPERKTRLKKIALYVKTRIKSGEPARLIFVCTHNSRRSHLSQIWAQVAASHYGIDRVETFSGGTEATAFNPRAIAAIKRAGLQVEKTEDGKNPHYAVRFQETREPLNCYSKVYSDPPNPQEDFCAVMTCSEADKNCPQIEGCSLRVAIAYADPKVADDKPEESATYDERCAQISREMLYLFSLVGN